MDKNGTQKTVNLLDSGGDKADGNGFVMSQECFMGLYTSMADGLAYTDHTGVIVHANPAFCSMIGYAEAELLGRTMLDLTPEDQRDAEAKIIRGLMASTENAGEITKQFRCKDGHIVSVHVGFWVNRDADGGVQGLWGVVRDMTDQFAAEAKARESEELFGFITDSADDVIWAVDANLRYTYLSPSIEVLRGFTPDELIGTSLGDSMSPESFERVQEAVGRNDNHETQSLEDFSERLELELLCKDGSTIWAEVMARGVRSDNLGWIGVVGTTRDITERRVMEERLREGEHSLRALMNATDDYMGLFKLGGEVLAVNASLAQLLGVVADDAVGKNIYDYLPKVLAEEAYEAVGRAVEEKKPVVTRGVLFGRFMEGTVYPVVDEGEVPLLAAFAKDVTDIRMAEEERRKTQEQYRLIVETANEGIFGLDANQRITYANDMLADFIGYDLTDIIGQNYSEFMDPGELDDNRKRIRNRREGKRERYERTFIRKDGTPVYGLISATPIMGEDESFLGSFAMIADITDVKQAHQRLLTILNDLDADVYVSDLETHEILFMNDHMQDKYGPFKSGTRCHSILRGLDIQCPSCCKGSLLDDQGKPVETLISEKYHDRLQRWHLNHDRAVEWLGGELVHLHLATDITELKNMEEDLKKAIIEAEAANLSKNEFLANMSHEIRTPLNGLLGMLQLMELTSLEPTQREYLSTAHESGRSLLQILNDILDLSKVESGKLELEESDVELGELLESVVSVFRHQAEGRGIQMTWTIDESLPRHFVADKGRLRQILFNLVGNATKFTVSGSIAVEAYPLQSSMTKGLARIFFKVTDTGIGIPDDKIDAVFDPFTQVDGSLTRKFQGTGLGLGIVSRLVQRMNGGVSILSEEGRGTTIAFTVEAMPIAKIEKKEPVQVAGEVEGNLAVLVAEDERVNRVVIERILTKIGHRPTCVSSGEEALELIKAQSFDLILTDIQMPGLDGLDTARAIREEHLLNTPVIALTAHAMKGDKERFIRAGMNGYIAKPFELSELRAEIERVMAESAAERNSRE